MEKVDFKKKMQSLGKKVGNRESPDPAPVLEQPLAKCRRAQQKSGRQNLSFQERNDQTYCRIVTFPDAKGRRLPTRKYMRFLGKSSSTKKVSSKNKKKKVGRKEKES